ncbi:aldehyde dehydrogenase [Microbacterium sp. NC79]|uniref:aldehyde dehydrogenase family protein n=1 Tax=Microbacterium sp. NC79 TaxID=2851009 RepID=UPI001C2B8D36|nr:aldehyde dehydrogenase family protein [Microbacterium sp. NC79]MBV0896120.1 aldehyde dehydrogenase family protein [Microbacterium sp. NC79]
MRTSTVPTYGSLIGGERLTAGDMYEVTDPNDGSVIALAHDADANAATAAANAAADAAPHWGQTSLDTRRAVLAGAARRLTQQRDALVELAIADTGARAAVAAEMQVDAALARLQKWSQAPGSLLKPQGPAEFGGLNVDLERRPVGVVACISPYNFPLLAMVAKVAPALFSGNTVVMKPAPQDPLLVSALAQALDEAAREAGAQDGTVNYVVGSTPDSGVALVEHPRVGAVSFTGSTVVGTSIYASAAPTMKRLLLELGGKGALIVRSDADIDAVATAIERAWTYHAGQVCLTASRILAHDSVYDELQERLQARVGELVHGDPRDAATHVAPLISEVQRTRVAGMIQRARDDGFTVAQSSGAPARGFHQAATLISDVRPDAEIMQEEVFGPVVALMRMRDDDHAIEVANSTKYALYDYVFSRDRDAAVRVGRQLDAAQVGINTVRRHPDAPFGGNRLSGLGRTGGTYALDSYTDLQALVG